MISARIHLKKDPVIAILGMKQELTKGAVKSAILEALKPVRKTFRTIAKARIRKRTGFFVKSISSKVKRYKHAAVGIVGASRKYKKKIGVYKKGKKKGQDIVYIPGYIDHLLDLGTKRSRAFPFREDAREATSHKFKGDLTNAVNKRLVKNLWKI
jgi:isocitrate dehydrogenase